MEVNSVEHKKTGPIKLWYYYTGTVDCLQNLTIMLPSRRILVLISSKELGNNDFWQLLKCQRNYAAVTQVASL